MDTLSIVDAFSDFNLSEKEPVPVVGGGLVTDDVGFACATYRRSTNYIRVPTTLIGLVDAGVAIKAVNHGKLKSSGRLPRAKESNFDFSFLQTLLTANTAELVKIAVVSNAEVFELLYEYGEDLLRTHFGYIDGTPKDVAYRVKYEAIKTMLNGDPNSTKSCLIGSPTDILGVPPRISSLSTAVAWSCCEYRHGTNSYYCGKPRLYHG